MSEENIRQAVEKIEATRARRGISVRDASRRVQHISEGYWRQFVKGGVSQSGVWVPKIPTVEQVLKMATAVGIGTEIADDLGVEPPATEMDEIDAALEAMRTAIAELERIKRDRRAV